MQPEDMRGDVPASDVANTGEIRIPDTWVGRRVEAVVVRPVNPDQPGYSTSLTAFAYEGVLEEVNDQRCHPGRRCSPRAPSTRGRRSSLCGSPKTKGSFRRLKRAGGFLPPGRRLFTSPL